MLPNRETEEKRQHSTPLIPYSSYEVRIPEALNNVTMHWHNEFEINLVLEGAGEFISGDHRFIAKEGDLLLFPPNMLHAAYPQDNKVLIYKAFVFHASMLGANSNDRSTIECIRPIMNGSHSVLCHIHPASDNYPEIKSTADRMFTCIAENQPHSDLLLKSELLRFFWLLEQATEPSLQNSPAISYTELVRPALEYMMENFHEAISIDDLANLVHLSKSYFMSCFKRAVGIGAIEHLTHLRINAACDALSGTNNIISDIAFTCGYSNLSNFNRQFKQMMGCSPKEYRKRNVS